MHFKRYWWALLSLLLAACSAARPATTNSTGEMTLPAVETASLAENERLRVVATTNIIGDVVEAVGGEQIALDVLVERGQDPHSYQPVASDLAAIEAAHVIFVNGWGLEEALLSAIEANASGTIVPVSAGVEPLSLDEDAHEDHAENHRAVDPHVWMDPANVMIWVENITQILSKTDPTHQQNYRANAEAYRARLDTLDAAIREQVAQVPPDRRKLVTDHETFNYYAAAYGFEVIGAVVPSFTSTAGVSAGDMAALAGIVVAEEVPAIFVGKTASQQQERLAEALANESGQPVAVIRLYTGSLDAPGQPGDTYIGMMRYNTEQIVAGLAETP